MQGIDPGDLGPAVGALVEDVAMHAANALGAPEGQPVGRAVASAGEAGWVDERSSSSGRAGRTRTSRNGIGRPGTFCGYRRSGPRLFSPWLPRCHLTTYD